MDIISSNPYRIDNGERFYTKAESGGHSNAENKLITEFSNFILQDGYPCVGAQAAMNGGTFAIGDFGAMGNRDTPVNLAYGISEYLKAMSDAPSDFLTYIAMFPESDFEDESKFETGLWALLTKLHDEDRKHFDWCPGYAKNPAENNFSFCFGRQGFFVVGLHPKSSRKARSFKHVAVAFNLQSQFEALREKGRFDVMRDAIRQREIDFQGTINPMLADLGKGRQAPQYSGRKVDKAWICPFSVQN